MTTTPTQQPTETKEINKEGAVLYHLIKRQWGFLQELETGHISVIFISEHGVLVTQFNIRKQDFSDFVHGLITNDWKRMK